MERTRSEMIKKGIRRQIVLHYFIVVFLTLMIVEIVFLIAIQTYYYNSIRQYMMNHAAVTTSYYDKFYANAFAEKDPSFLPSLLKMFSLDNTELQILNTKGEVLISSSGFQVEKSVQTSDVSQALNGSTGRWFGKQAGTNESVMAITAPLKINGETSYLLRYVTSLEAVNGKIMSIVLLAVAVGIVILALVLIISIGLANSIVKPLNNITAVSAQMARGRFDVRVEGNYRYELGELASTLNYMAEEIVRSDKVKNDFISSISHELRTPLTGIKGWSETLESGNFTDPEETKLGMHIISKETERLIGLVEELLDFSRLQQKEVKLNMNYVELETLISETILQVRSKAEQKQIQLTMNVSGVPSPVVGDQNRLKQVFLNLIDNAIKFSHPESNIFIHIDHTDETCTVSVRDTGIGISEEHVKKVTEKFYQVNPLGGGTGLGLAITNELVEQHHGHLEIESQPGLGTTVSVMLPKAPRTEPQPENETQKQQQEV